MQQLGERPTPITRRQRYSAAHKNVLSEEISTHNMCMGFSPLQLREACNKGSKHNATVTGAVAPPSSSTTARIKAFQRAQRHPATNEHGGSGESGKKSQVQAQLGVLHNLTSAWFPADCLSTRVKSYRARLQQHYIVVALPCDVLHIRLQDGRQPRQLAVAVAAARATARLHAVACNPRAQRLASQPMQSSAGSYMLPSQSHSREPLTS